VQGAKSLYYQREDAQIDVAPFFGDLKITTYFLKKIVNSACTCQKDSKTVRETNMTLLVLETVTCLISATMMS
jgi:hypothetical protein